MESLYATLIGWWVDPTHDKDRLPAFSHDGNGEPRIAITLFSGEIHQAFDKKHTQKKSLKIACRWSSPIFNIPFSGGYLWDRHSFGGPTPTSPENPKKSWMSCTKNCLLKSKSPSFPLPDTGKTHTSSAKALPWGKHPPLDKGQTRTRRVPMQLRSQTSREKRDAAMENECPGPRRWPGWTVDESCSFSTRVGDPSFLPTNVDTLTLCFFFFGEDQTPPKFHGIPAKTEKNPWSCRFETFLEGSFGWKNFRPTFDWLKFTQPLPILFRSSVEQFFGVSK